jgi:hypothetical protein
MVSAATPYTAGDWFEMVPSWRAGTPKPTTKITSRMGIPRNTSVYIVERTRKGKSTGE